MSMSVARSSHVSAAVSSWTPESAWSALRVDATLLTVWSWVNSASRSTVSFTVDTSS
jgi:hypothetical protein